jgi:hypothetical protein
MAEPREIESVRSPCSVTLIKYRVDARLFNCKEVVLGFSYGVMATLSTRRDEHRGFHRERRSARSTRGFAAVSVSIAWRRPQSARACLTSRYSLAPQLLARHIADESGELRLRQMIADRS